MATFKDYAWFNYATFTNVARFDKAKFTGNADFERTVFENEVIFAHATLPSIPYSARDDDNPKPWTDFSEAKFVHDVPPEVGLFVSRPAEEASGGREAE